MIAKLSIFIVKFVNIQICKICKYRSHKLKSHQPGILIVNILRCVLLFFMNRNYFLNGIMI